ncbi:Lethal(2) giant larvae protein 1 [Homalodisca vitripennis]|nr:Lethal(2) giant larvae protein 1 [Homalodisca vitripennis]
MAEIITLVRNWVIVSYLVLDIDGVESRCSSASGVGGRGRVVVGVRTIAGVGEAFSSRRDRMGKRRYPCGHGPASKEIQLKHRAPVITVSVVDGECNEVETRQTTDCPPPHRVIITSEEQIKIFTLPALKPLCKLKLTAGEGARVRRTALSRFCTSAITTAPPGHAETCLLCLTNLGDVIVLNLPELRRQINAAVIRREDINGISSLVFTREGEALYLHSSSELQRISLSAVRTTVAHCALVLPAHARTVQTQDTSDDQSSSDSESSDDSSSSSSSDSDSQRAEADQAGVEEKQGEVEVCQGSGRGCIRWRSSVMEIILCDRASTRSALTQRSSLHSICANPAFTSPFFSVFSDVLDSLNIADVLMRCCHVHVGEVRENGLPEADLTCNHLDLSSVGDITIDSVKDHLVNSATEESRIVTTELVRNETTKLETTTESVVVKTTVITTNETTLITPPSERKYLYNQTEFVCLC